MSTYWYLYCRTCQEGDTERVGWWNHGIDRGLREVVGLLPEIARFAAASEAVAAPLLDIRIEWSGPEDRGGLNDFAQKHHAHEVVCKNEYGAYEDRCGEFFHCEGEGCGRAMTCDQLVGHDGKHRRIKP